MKKNYSWLGACAFLVVAGWVFPRSGHSEPATKCYPPAIHYIGGTPWIFVDKGTPNNKRPVDILVKGENLLPHHTSVHVSSISPAVIGYDYALMDRSSERVESGRGVDDSAATVIYGGSQQRTTNFLVVRLFAPFVQSLEDNDNVTISIAVKTDNRGHQCSDYRAFGVGKFVVRDAKKFRAEEQGNRFPFSDITATPLSFKEAHYLFGPLVAENYFVVKMALRNTSKQQRVLTTGMIRVSGMALVEPAESSKAAREQEGNQSMAADGYGSVSGLGGSPDPKPANDVEAAKGSELSKPATRFTLPVTVSPTGLTQVYKIMDDTHPHQGRSVFFRLFDLFGTVASAAATSFSVSGDLVKGVSLLTGNVRPGLDAAWHDSWPAFRSNVVEFGMQDTVKVGKNTEVPHKFLFFSKNTVQAQLQDPAFFGEFLKGGWIGHDWYNAFIPADQQKQPELPKAAAVSLFFNQLDIPFETVDDDENASKEKSKTGSASANPAKK